METKSDGSGAEKASREQTKEPPVQPQAHCVWVEVPCCSETLSLNLDGISLTSVHICILFVYSFTKVCTALPFYK